MMYSNSQYPKVCGLTTYYNKRCNHIIIATIKPPVTKLYRIHFFCISGIMDSSAYVAETSHVLHYRVILETYLISSPMCSSNWPHDASNVQLVVLVTFSMKWLAAMQTYM